MPANLGYRALGRGSGRRQPRPVKRFRQIVRGLVKKDFRKYLTQGELIGRQGRHVVSIPLPQIEIPRFRFGQTPCFRFRLQTGFFSGLFTR